MVYNREQFRDLIYRTLREVELPRKHSAIDLLLGTAAQESAFGTYLRQVNGPALGAFQMEPATFLYVQKESSIGRYHGIYAIDSPADLEWNLRLAIVSARINYLLKPGSIPDTVEGQARYWKQWWNTRLGKGTVDQYLSNWARYCE